MVKMSGLVLSVMLNVAQSVALWPAGGQVQAWSFLILP
jgi:hypothetical protein